MKEIQCNWYVVTDTLPAARRWARRILLLFVIALIGLSFKSSSAPAAEPDSTAWCFHYEEIEGNTVMVNYKCEATP